MCQLSQSSRDCLSDKGEESNSQSSHGVKGRIANPVRVVTVCEGKGV